MQWCCFQVGDNVSYGIVEDETRVTAVSGSPFKTDTVTATTYPLSAVKLPVPVIPPTFYAGGLNYPEHVKWWAQYSGTPPRVATEPGIGYRTTNARIAHEEPIVKPTDASDEFQVEGELVAVIGTKARHLSPEHALSCVLGSTIGNDVSQRTWQLRDGSLWRAKNADTFKPMGPWIATDLHPNNPETTIRMNGQVQSQFNTRHMLFDAASQIAKISRYSTLYPGDVVWLGAGGRHPDHGVGGRGGDRDQRYRDPQELRGGRGGGDSAPGTRSFHRGAAVFQRVVVQGRRHRPADTGEKNVGVSDHGVYSPGTDGHTGVTRGVWRWRDRPGMGAYHGGRVRVDHPPCAGVGGELL
jgi:2-keto-4-pentenoate hydratase/2-oxohepta-3-ene-1,7-dioic acid hydratase in catechol pathway